MNIFSWQTEIYLSLLQRKQQLPHAFLFSGIQGIGKKHFAFAFANALFCTQLTEQNQPCGICRDCCLFKAKSHPDLVIVEPEEDSKTIKIDQIREVVSFVNETALLGGYRIIIIHPASAMNINAANALLKTLEEPSPNTLIILINHGMTLPATILSRCQKINFPKPEEVIALQWLAEVCGNSEVNSGSPRLSASQPRDDGIDKSDDSQLSVILKLAAGAPLKAKELLTTDILATRDAFYQSLLQPNPLTLAATWQDKNLEILFMLFLPWLRDLLCLKLQSDPAVLINSDYQSHYNQLTTRILHNSLVSYIDYAQEIYAKMLQSVSLNRLLTLETLFIRWAQLCS